MSDCEWGDRESCISPRPGPACGACTEWLCVRIRELEAGRLVLENFVRKLANYDYRGNPPWYVSEAIALLKDEEYV